MILECSFLSANKIIGSVLTIRIISSLQVHTTGKEETFDGVSPKIEVKLTLSIVLVLIVLEWLGFSVIPARFTGTLDSIITYTLGLFLPAVGVSLVLKSILSQVSREGFY